MPKHRKVVRIPSALAAVALLAGLSALPLNAQSPGETTFRTYCAACHSTGPERILGPGLGGVLERRDREWLISKITAPDRLLADGDTISVRLVAEYGMAMGSFGISREQAESILGYLGQLGAAPASQATSPAPAPMDMGPPSPDQVALGQALFQGSRRFENRGTACNACHDVSFSGTLGGGSLAIALTDSHARLGAMGIQALLTTPPFPVMRSAYEGRPLTEPEITALVSFLQQASIDQAQHPGRSYGAVFLGAGFAGFLLLLGISSAAWRGRRRGSVNQSIMDRQVRST